MKRCGDFEMKLTKTIVERVVRKVVQHRFSAEVLDARCAEAKLFNEAWAHLPAAVEALADRKSDLVKRIKEAEAKVTAALTGTTRAKAIQLWPEIEPFLPVEAKPAGLPALPTKELNALLDLPVEEAA